MVVNTERGGYSKRHYMEGWIEARTERSQDCPEYIFQTPPGDAKEYKSLETN